MNPISTRLGACLLVAAAFIVLPAAATAQEPPAVPDRPAPEAAPPDCPRLPFFQWDTTGFEWEGEGSFEGWDAFFRRDSAAVPGRDTTSAWPRVFELQFPSGRFPGIPGAPRYGLRLQDLNEELGRYFGRTDGALVLEVLDDGALDLEAGDVIVSIDGRAVENAAHASRILQSYEPDEEMVIEVWREGRSVTVRDAAPPR